jgi:hypothetical protein
MYLPSEPQQGFPLAGALVWCPHITVHCVQLNDLKPAIAQRPDCQGRVLQQGTACNEMSSACTVLQAAAPMTAMTEAA